MKSLEQVLATTDRNSRVLSEMLPEITTRLSSVVYQTLGIDGFFFQDLMVEMAEDYHQITSAQVRLALEEQGWVSVCKMIPGRKDRIQIFMKKEGVF